MVLIPRASGILLHVTSLPSEYGIGDLGPAAFEFVDLLVRSGQRVWQMLPLNPISGSQHFSPYSSSSAYAGNRYVVSPQSLVDDGYLQPGDLDPLPSFPANRVDYDAVTKYKQGLLDKAWQTFKTGSNRSEFDAFVEREDGWLEEFSLFQAAKRLHRSQPWNRWPDGLRDRQPEALRQLASEQGDLIEKVKFEQFLFWQQWYRVKKYANDRGVLLFGDLPIYVTHDSVDTWASPDLFKLDQARRPKAVAGVPPDYFSKTGQLWGNPVYDWDKMAATGYRWWLARLEHTLRAFDIVRIDHFRGLVAYWEIPAGQKTAVKGRWVKVPAEEFLSEVTRRIKDPAVVAEDLGTIDDDVRHVLKKFGFPGMRILSFAFDDDDPKNRYLPENYTKDSVVYTGTHDNNTVVGWFRNDAGAEQKARLEKHAGRSVSERDVHWALVEMAQQSRARLAVTPLQDVLGLDESARMNTPATINGNWSWRVTPPQLATFPSQKLADLARSSNRVSSQPSLIGS